MRSIREWICLMCCLFPKCEKWDREVEKCDDFYPAD